MTIMPHLRSVNKGAFLLLREGVISLINEGSQLWLNIIPKIIKIQELPGASPPGPNQGVALDPLEALRRPPDPMPL